MRVPSVLIPMIAASLRLSTGDPAASTSLPVRWIPDPRYPITSLSQCADWRRTRPVSLGGDHRLELSFQDERPKILCSTVEDWIRGRESGAFAYSTFDMTMESHFQNAALWYVYLPLMNPSTRTSFPAVEVGLGARRGELLRNSQLPKSIERSPQNRFDLDADGWGFSSEDGDRWEWLHPIGLGDWDGDGWEDLLAMQGYGYSEGSGRYYWPILFARRASGRFVEISPRLPRETATPAEIAADRSRWLDSCGLPEGREITLKGSMTLDDDRVLPITMRITLDDGYVTGSYCYDRIGKPIVVEGAFGLGQQVCIEEFPDGRVQAASFSLEWKREGDRLALSGRWYKRGQSWGNEVQLRGDLGLATRPEPAAAPGRRSH